MGKRGLSAEEKKEKLKEVLSNGKVPLTLKQVEKLGGKAGVSQMTIKGLMEEMVSDGVVDMDKIGSTNWYWRFPGNECVKLTASAAKLQEEVQANKAAVKALKAKKEALQKARPPSKEREALLARLRELEQEKVALETHQQENNPDEAIRLVKMVDVAKEAATRWTDNTWELLSFLKKKTGRPTKELNSMLKVKDDFDYPVYQPPKRKKAKAA
mmetsp:Transcript_18826/g.34883  ORF Transcript_18826/g.34883 Transcript_18826/m.34883 type:complete len:213 (-) Transcript_18826:101-739(-)